MEDADIMGGLTSLHDKILEDLQANHLTYIPNPDATSRLLLKAATRIDQLMRAVESAQPEVARLRRILSHEREVWYREREAVAQARNFLSSIPV